MLRSVKQARHAVANPTPDQTVGQRAIAWLLAKSAHGHLCKQARIWRAVNKLEQAQ